MKERLTTIVEGLLAVEGLIIHKSLTVDFDGMIHGGITISVSDCSLQFDVVIYAPYPLQFHNCETIQFINTSLLCYNHVNSDGSICIHTPHNADLKSKIYYDILSLRGWISKYYLNKEEDRHYSHIMVSEPPEKSYCSTYLFTEVDHKFRKGDFGHVYISPLSKGHHKDKPILTHLIQGFRHGKQLIQCKWSKPYAQLSHYKGLFIFTEVPPVRNVRFIIENWKGLEQYVDKDFLKFIYNIKKDSNFKKLGIKNLPLLIGYNIPNGEVHWQCSLIDVDAFPIYTEKESGSYIGHFSESAINWALTKNCSYKYFFGRGAFCEVITDKKILIIGIGAIGSMVATTLTRGGCKSISIADYDVKEPENVCRSEYKFKSGLNSKVLELKEELEAISPFIKLAGFTEFIDAVKQFINNDRYREPIKKEMEEYDLIIDCTADNDVAFILETLSISSDIINLSVTNSAEELMCVVKPNLYERLVHISTTLHKEQDDLYSPVGCWSPTFRASYNDIALLVQFALKNINSTLEKGNPLRSFYLKSDGINITTQQF